MFVTVVSLCLVYYYRFVYVVEFEQINIYLQKFDVWSLKLFDLLYLFIVIALGG